MKTKKPTKEELSRLFATVTDVIDENAIKQMMVKVSREQLIANGASKKRVAKLSDEAAVFCASEQMRQFCGMGPSVQYIKLMNPGVALKGI